MGQIEAVSSCLSGKSHLDTPMACGDRHRAKACRSTCELFVDGRLVEKQVKIQDQFPDSADEVLRHSRFRIDFASPELF